MTTPPKAVEQQYISAANRLKNPGFELGKKFWDTSLGGTFTLNQNTANANSGKASISWDASSASHVFASEAVTVASGDGLSGANVVVSCAIKTPSGTATHTLQLHDGSNVLASETITSSTTYARTSVSGQAPTSGILYLRVDATASDEPSITIDDCLLMKAEDYVVYQVSQASKVASIKWAATSNCLWSTSSATYGTPAADADCPAPTVTGIASAPGTKIPAMVTSSLAPGDYLLVMNGGVQTFSDAGNNESFIRWYDTTGSVQYGNDVMVKVTRNANTDTSIAVGSHLTTFTVSSPTSALTLAYQSKNLGGGTVNLDARSSSVEMTLYYFPSAAQTGYKPDEIAWKIDANIAGSDPSLGVADATTYTALTSTGLTLTQNTGSAAVQIACSGTTPPEGTTCNTAGVAESVGIAFTIPKAGDYEVCAEFAHRVDTGAGGFVWATFQLIETPTNSSTTLTQEGKSRIMSTLGTSNINVVHPMNLCGTFNFTSTGQKVVRLMYEQDANASLNSNIIMTNTGANYGQYDMHWVVKPLNNQQNAPLLVNSVVNTSTGVTRVEVARLNCDSSATIVSEYGSWVSSIGNISSGSCTVTLDAGVFSSAPYCFASWDGTGANVIILAIASSATSVTFGGVTDAGAASTTANGYLQCVGAK